MPGVPVYLPEKIGPKPHFAIVQMSSLQSEKQNANQNYGEINGIGFLFVLSNGVCPISPAALPD